MIYTIKQNDTYPPLKAILQMRTGAYIRIEGAEVKLTLTNEDDEVVLSEVVTIDDVDTGTVHYNWQAENTSTVGEYKGEFQITWMDGSILTVPNNGYFTLNIVKDLGEGVEPM